MKRTVICAAVFTFAATASFSAAYASNTSEFGNIPHVLSAVQYPPGNARFVRHTIRIRSPKGSHKISQLTINILSNLTVSNNITVHDTSGKKIEANTSVNGNKVLIDFPQDFDSRGDLEIDLNNVKTLRTSRIWLYRVNAKLAGSSEYLSIGVGEIRVHR